jgi:hypothetical protein
MTMTFIPESFRVAPESFGVVSAVIVAVLAAIVITGFWELFIQEIKLRRLEQKRERQIATNQDIESDRNPNRDNGIDIGGGRERSTNTKSVQSSMRHFARAVERLQNLDSKSMGDDLPIHRVTQDLAGDLRGMWSARDLANVQSSKNLPLLLHGKGSNGMLRRQGGSRRCR